MPNLTVSESQDTAKKLNFGGAMKATDIQGTWELVEFVLVRTSGAVDPWGIGTTGLLIYSASGHMAVSINRAPNPITASAAERNFDAGLFYAGTYKIEGSTIAHQVSIASDLARVGKEQTRFANLEGNLLVLTSPQESFGTAKVKWRRIK